MPSCSAYGCTSRDPTNGITFHMYSNYMIQEFVQNDICYYSGDVFVLLVNYYF